MLLHGLPESKLRITGIGKQQPFGVWKPATCDGAGMFSVTRSGFFPNGEAGKLAAKLR
jgi:hypothetical protein